MKKIIILILAIVMFAAPAMAEMLKEDGTPMTLADYNAGGKVICRSLTEVINAYIAEGNPIPTSIEQLYAIPKVGKYFANQPLVEDAFLILYEPGLVNQDGVMNPFTIILCARFGSQCFVTTSTTMETQTMPSASFQKELSKHDKSIFDGSYYKRIDIQESYKGLHIFQSDKY